MNDEAANAARSEITEIVRKNLKGPLALLTAYQEFQHLVTTEKGTFIRAWADAGHTLEETEAEIERLGRLSEAVVDKSELFVQFRMITVDASGLQESLRTYASTLRKGLLEDLAAKWHATNRENVDKFEEIVQHMNQTPDTTEGMDELEKFVGAIEGQLDEFVAKIEYAKKVSPRNPLLMHSIFPETPSALPLRSTGVCCSSQGPARGLRGQQLSVLGPLLLACAAQL